MPTLIQLAKSKTVLFITALSLLAIGVATAVLRFLTTVPLADK
jgi:hypothetical protein